MSDWVMTHRNSLINSIVKVSPSYTASIGVVGDQCFRTLPVPACDSQPDTLSFGRKEFGLGRSRVHSAVRVLRGLIYRPLWVRLKEGGLCSRQGKIHFIWVGKYLVYVKIISKMSAHSWLWWDQGSAIKLHIPFKLFGLFILWWGNIPELFIEG